MNDSPGLSGTAGEQHSMEERWKWYLAGAIDTAGVVGVEIKKDDRYSVGYTIQPKVMLNRTSNYDIIFGMLDEFCEDIGVNYRIAEVGKSNRFVVDSYDHVEILLKELHPRLVQQKESASIILNEILPALREEKHTTEEGFLEVMHHVNNVRENQPPASRESKYDRAYFLKEFSK